jgi:hypothetical protein
VIGTPYNKSLHTKNLSQVTSQPYNSPFWKGIMKLKEEFLKGYLLS